jgi:hypothetical protein
MSKVSRSTAGNRLINSCWLFVFSVDGQVSLFAEIVNDFSFE